MWRQAMEYRVTGFLEYKERRDHPWMDDLQERMLLNISQWRFQANQLSFRLCLTYQFNRNFLKQFRRVESALVFSMENTETGQASVGKMVDPYRRLMPLTGPNFVAQKLKSPPTEFVKGWLSLPLEVRMQQPMTDPSFFITVSLQHTSSNTVAIDFAHQSILSYKEGNPHVIPIGMLSKDA